LEPLLYRSPLLNKSLQIFLGNAVTLPILAADSLPILNVYGLFVLSGAERAQLEAKAKARDKAAEKKLGMTLTDFGIKTLKDTFQSTMEKTISPKELTATIIRILNQKAGIGWTDKYYTFLIKKSSLLASL